MSLTINTRLFVITSGLAWLLSMYIVLTKTTLQPRLFITTCGEIFQNVSEHIHINPSGMVSFIVLLTVAIGLSLSFIQFMRFLLAHPLHQKFDKKKQMPKNVRFLVEKHNIQYEIVLIGQSKRFAYTIGFLRPKIVISKSFYNRLTKEQLEAVILHELYHAKNYHVLWLLMSRLISALFFFVPLISYLSKQLKTEFELAADAFVVSTQNTRTHVSRALALNLQYADTELPHFAAAPIEKRVASLLGKKHTFEKIGIKSLLLSIVSLALMIGIAFSQPVQVDAALFTQAGEVCKVDEECQTTDCANQEIFSTHNFTPLLPASFQHLSAS
ncbi:M56 family peptidase [Candidatus Microgenomates bacterium]|nr:MAG: M56 family peptidase [Candidatus Microgenomates bacterium]